MVHDVSKKLVLAFRQDRQVLCELAGLGLRWMQMPERFHVRHAHHKKVHEMAMVRDQVVHANAVRLLGAEACWLGFIGIAELQPEQTAAERWIHLGKLVIEPRVGAGFSAPPMIAGKDGNKHQAQQQCSSQCVHVWHLPVQAFLRDLIQRHAWPQK